MLNKDNRWLHNVEFNEMPPITPATATTASPASPPLSLVVRSIATVIFCGLFILFAGTVFDAVGVAFGVEQIIMAAIAGTVGSFRLLSGS